MQRFLLASILMALLALSVSKPAPLQYIPSAPGIVPVYIRPGDTPLEDINPELAAAFDSFARRHNRIIYGRSADDLEPPQKTKGSDGLEDLSLEDDNAVTETTRKTVVFHESQHIQKIPRT